MPLARTATPSSGSDCMTHGTPTQPFSPVMRAPVTGKIYAGVSEKAKAQIATKLTDAGFGS
jgi:hypothetical protein